MSEDRSLRVGYGYLVLTMVLFSTIEVAVKLLVGFVPPLRLAAVRFLGAGIVLMPLAWHRIRERERCWNRRDYLVLLILGIVGVTFALSFYHASLCFLPASVGAVVFSANPIFVALFAALLGEERVEWRTVAAVVLGSLGVFMVAWNQGRIGPGWVPGIIFMFIAQAAFAYYSVLARRFMPRFGAMTITSAASLIGGSLLAGVSRIIEGPFSVHLSVRLWGVMLYLIIGATAIPYILFFHGLVRVGAARGATLFFLKPLLAPLFAWWLLGESLKPSLFGGAALIIAGLVLEILPTRLSTPPD